MRVCAALYREVSTDPRDTIFVAGAARSGTTWVAELITSQTHGRLMFEPFNPDLVLPYARFNYFQYMRPEHDDVELLRFVESVLSGSIRDPWIDRYVDRLRPRGRLIKDIRANLLLRWIHDRFPEVPMVFVIRHPCAVVASRMKLGWATDGDIGCFVDQSDLVDDFLADKLEIIKGATTDAEKHAIIWCISNLVPLTQFDDAELNVVFYEELRRSPETEVPRLFDLLGIGCAPEAIRTAARSSMTAKGHVRRTDMSPAEMWHTHLPPDLERSVLKIVESFGLSYLYDDNGKPQTIPP